MTAHHCTTGKAVEGDVIALILGLQNKHLPFKKSFPVVPLRSWTLDAVNLALWGRTSEV
jgi:hypothetical protein